MVIITCCFGWTLVDFDKNRIEGDGMKILLMTVAAAGSLMVAGTVAAADAGEALAQKNGCLACHNVQQKVIGPAYKDIAAKYKGDKTAEAKLIDKIKKGGSGTWGPIPMPPNSPQVKDEDIKTIVQWVLKL